MTTGKLLRSWLPLLALLTLSVPSGGTGVASDVAAPSADQATPKVVKLKLENDRVRVLETLSNPGDKELLHSHPENLVYVIEGAKLRVTTPDGKSNVVEFKAGDTIWRQPVTHSAENIGTTRLHAIIVEFKR